MNWNESGKDTEKKKIDKTSYNQIGSKSKGGDQGALKGLLQSDNPFGGYKVV